MKNLFYISIFCFATLLGCKQNNVVPNDIELKTESVSESINESIDFELLPKMSLKNKKKTAGLSHVKITSKDQFNQYIDTEFNTKHLESFSSIDFSTQMVLIMIGNDSNIETTFNIKSIKNQNNSIEINYSLNELKLPNKIEEKPIALVLLNKMYNKDVRFILNKI